MNQISLIPIYHVETEGKELKCTTQSFKLENSQLRASL